MIPQRLKVTAYYSPTARRSFLTLEAACSREASAMLSKKYPPEAAEHDTGYVGFHWSSDERLCAVHRRLKRRLKRQFRVGQEVGNG